jgi:GST-like protein
VGEEANVIDFYGLPTPNCWKVATALEELGLDYRYSRVDIAAGDQFASDFAAISPNRKVPLIVDRAPADGGAPQRVFESDAILLYLAEKTGELLPADPRDRFEVIQWLFWDASNVGEPHSTRLAFIAEPGSPGSVTKEGAEKNREAAAFLARKIRAIYEEADRQLAGREYLCGAYSIADIALLGHVTPHRMYGVVEDLAELPELARWYARLRARPAVKRAYALDLEIFDGIPDAFRRPLLDE